MRAGILTLSALLIAALLFHADASGIRDAERYNAPPGADFSAQPTSGFAPLIVTFTDLSTGSPTSWYWNFGDGDTSSLQNPVHTYTTGGSFDVTLTVSNLEGSNLKTVQDYIHVTVVPDAIPVMDFDSLADFSLTFDPWTVNDVGGGNTYGISNVSFLHSGEPMAFICFNPSATTPPLTTMIPHSGKKLGACFSSTASSGHNPNNKWLISPVIHIKPSEKIGFWVETYNKDYQLEKYNVGVSITGTNPADFTIISGAQPQTAPDIWTYREYDLAPYAGQNVYVGIQCVSDDQFIFLIDDIRIGYALGISGKSIDDVVTVYPNPANDRFFICTGNINAWQSVELINNLGTVAREMMPGKNENVISLDLNGMIPGIYYVRIIRDNQVFIKKVIIENQ